MSFKADSIDDLSRLSRALCALPSWYVLAHVHDLDLMRCRQQPLAFLMWVLHKTKGTNGMLHFFVNMNKRSPDTVTEWFVDTLRHLHFGKDTEDRPSVGGWSQREIDLLVERLPVLANWSEQ